LKTKEEDMYVTIPEFRECGGERPVANADEMQTEKKRIIRLLRTIHNIAGVRIAVVLMLVVAFSAAAMAQCGGSFSALAAAAASLPSQPKLLPSTPQPSVENQSAAAKGNANNTSIVGLWHINFLVGGEPFQEAFQIWNAGGTEVHNPNVDPRQGNVCLGTWTELPPHTFKLAHRVFLYDTSGNFMGVGHLSETLVLSDRGNTHSGSFTLAVYDPSGNFLFEVPGTVVGERISAN